MKKYILGLSIIGLSIINLSNANFTTYGGDEDYNPDMVCFDNLYVEDTEDSNDLPINFSCLSYQCEIHAQDFNFDFSYVQDEGIYFKFNGTFNGCYDLRYDSEMGNTFNSFTFNTTKACDEDTRINNDGHCPINGGGEGGEGGEGGDNSGNDLIGSSGVIIDGLKNTVYDVIPLLVYIGLGILSVSIGFVVIRWLINFVRNNIFKPFR